VPGVDILHRQMDLEEKAPLDAAARAYCQKLKRHALTNGVDLICLSIHQNFRLARRGRAAEAHRSHCQMQSTRFTNSAFRAFALNSGRWNTIKSL
jgi:hypothetical protein